MGEDLIKDCRYVFRVEVQLGEGTDLGQSLDIPLEIGGLDQSGFCWDDEDFDLAEQWSPVQRKVFERVEIVFPPGGVSAVPQCCKKINELGQQHEHAGEAFADARVNARCERELIVEFDQLHPLLLGRVELERQPASELSCPMHSSGSVVSGLDSNVQML